MPNAINLQTDKHISSETMQWKTIAWNGSRFSVPHSWEAAQIDPFHLVLEDTSGPVMEIKWRRVKGNFSHQQQLRQLAAQHKGRQVNSCPMPPTWERALRSYQSLAFNWRTESAGGKGLILYCNSCRTATLIQFVGPKQTHPDMTAVAARLLESYKDHSISDTLLWSLFDIRAQIPTFFTLSRHRFDAGEFELSFKTKGLSLDLYRWGLAGMCLKDKDLLTFGEEKIPLQGTERVLLPETLFPTAEWRFTAASRFSRMQCRLGSQKPFQRARIWHLEAKDRLLGVRMRGVQPLPEKLFEDIVRHYTIIA